MSVRMRHTKGHTGNRRSHHALTASPVVKDKETGALRLPHRIDEATGRYRGKQIAEPRAPKAHAHTHEHGPHTYAPEEKVEGKKSLTKDRTPEEVQERSHPGSEGK